jgi:hypothetical protein
MEEDGRALLGFDGVDAPPDGIKCATLVVSHDQP